MELGFTFMLATHVYLFSDTTTLFVSHIVNTQEREELTRRCTSLETKLAGKTAAVESVTVSHGRRVSGGGLGSH